MNSVRATVLTPYTTPYGALKTIQLQQGSNPKLVDRGMVYDPVGNLASIADGVNRETITYTYDAVDRLLTAGSPVSETYEYNQIGNITAKNGLSFSYDAAHKHAVSGYNGASYTYDANGCLTSTSARDGQSIAYDTETRPVRVDSGGTICRFAYDGDGVRRKSLDSKGTIHYVGSYERNLGNGTSPSDVVTKYYKASFGRLSRLIAFRKGGTLYWVGTDHLGSTIRVADSSFVPVDGMRYRPFGGSRDAGTGLITDHKFTGQIEDQSIGLYWYASRAYDPAIGRFVCPDSIVPEPKNPQSLNRYTYCLSNPLKYTDPTGHVFDWGGGDSFDSPYDEWVEGDSTDGDWEIAPDEFDGSDGAWQAVPSCDVPDEAAGPAWNVANPNAVPYSAMSWVPSGEDVVSAGLNVVSEIGEHMPDLTAPIDFWSPGRIPSPGKATAYVMGKVAVPLGFAVDAVSGVEDERARGHTEGRALTIGIGSAAAGAIAALVVGAVVAPVAVGAVAVVGAGVLIVGTGFVVTKGTMALADHISDRAGWH